MLNYELLIFCCRLWHKEYYKAKYQKERLDSYPKELFHSMGSPQWKCHPLLHTSPHPWLPPLSVEASDSTNHFCTTATTTSNSPNKRLTTKIGTYILFMHWLLVWRLVICWPTSTIAAVILVIVFILVAALFGSLLWLLIRRGSTLHCHYFP